MNRETRCVLPTRRAPSTRRAVLSASLSFQSRISRYAFRLNSCVIVSIMPRFGVYDTSLDGVRQVACHEISIVTLLDSSRNRNSCIIGFVTKMGKFHTRCCPNWQIGIIKSFCRGHSTGLYGILRQNENTKDTVSDGRGAQCGGHILCLCTSGVRGCRGSHSGWRRPQGGLVRVHRRAVCRHRHHRQAPHPGRGAAPMDGAGRRQVSHRRAQGQQPHALQPHLLRRGLRLRGSRPLGSSARTTPSSRTSTRRSSPSP